MSAVSYDVRDPVLKKIYGIIVSEQSIVTIGAKVAELFKKPKPEGLGRAPTKNDWLDFKKYIFAAAGSNPSFKHMRLTEVQNWLANKYVERVKAGCKPEEVDLREEFFKDTIAEVDDASEYKFGANILYAGGDGGGTISINPDDNTVTIGNKNEYIVFDSRWRDTSKIFWQWNINASSVAQAGSAMINTQDFQNIYEMEIFEFDFPLTPESDNYYDMITLEIRELNKQGYYSAGNYRYHFSFRPKNNGNRLRLIPIVNKIKFSKPINNIQNFQFIFRNPHDVITPPRDVFTVVHTPGSNPAEFTTVDAAPHNMQSGDLAIFDNFVSTSTALNDAITEEKGYIITKTGATSFTINVNTTGFSGGDKVVLYTAYARSVIHMRFGFVSV